jgi:hypothetical protein
VTPRISPWQLHAGGVCLAMMAAAGATGCNDTRLSIEQTGKTGSHMFLLTARECSWANTPEGECVLALSYQWDTHAGQFILEGVRSSYLRLVIKLPKAVSGPGGGGEFPLTHGMVHAHDDYDRGMCFTGGPGHVTVHCGKDNRVTGTFMVTCRGFLPGRGEKSLFSDDYVMRAWFEASPDAAATLRMLDQVDSSFATPQRYPVYKKPRKGLTPPPGAPAATPSPAPPAPPAETPAAPEP